MPRVRVALAILVVACGSPPAQLAPALLTQRIEAPPSAVMTGAARVLAIHGFTLAPIDRATGVIQSQPLEVTTTWEGAMVKDRVDCGKDMGGDRATLNPVQITLGIITTPEGAGTSVALRPSATSYDAVARRMAGSGNPIMAGMSGTFTCQFRPEFVQALMAELATAARGAQ